MEKDTKQHSISYNKGITNQPSYILADDGELSECHGLTFENGELKPIQDAKRIQTGVPNAKILAVHDGRYIYESTSGGRSCLLYTKGSLYGYLVTYFTGDLIDVEIVGNTVVASTTEEIHYALWTNRSDHNYEDLESNIPEPEFGLRLVNGTELHDRLYYGGMIEDDIIKSPEAWNDAVYGLYDSMKNKLNSYGEFVEPFVARVAVELYDGSYTMHSSPIPMLPWFTLPIFAMFYQDAITSETQNGHVYLYGSRLQGYMKTDYSKWSDIVKGVSVFISRGVPMFNRMINAAWEQHTHPGGLRIGRRLTSNVVNDIVTPNQPGSGSVAGDEYDRYFKLLDGINNSSIRTSLAEESVFFHLCGLGYSSSYTDLAVPGNALNTLEARQQLPNEDYHTHDAYAGGQLYSYNGRLHVAGVSRRLFSGFTSFFEWRTQGSFYYTIVVTIKTENGYKTVKTDPVYTSEAIGSFYFFYPDSRAEYADIYVGYSYWKRITLTEHPGLNGAYWMDSDLPGYQYALDPSGSGGSIPSVDPIENLPNTLMVSEASNPMLFLAHGYVKVGNTPIIGMAAVTMALSEYQHGSHPLVVFTEDGIWSLSLNAEGNYVAGQAVSREVCNNASSITQVDNGIFFASAKGLMYLDTAGVKCVSAQMKGTEFDDFIDTCFMAYDYRDSLLHIYRTSGANWHYVYNMKTGTFSTADGRASNTVNNYPDTLIQYHVTDWQTSSLLNKDDEQHDTEEAYNGYIETRPMKFGNILTLKSIRHIRHLYVMNSNAEVSLTVTASNDGVNWTNPALTSLRGKPWKLFKFRITFNMMKATDRYAGTVVWTQERRTEKPR